VLLLQRANFLVLDEPTNHLDINARESLESMLIDFDGTILFVSHDRFFMDKVATKLWVVHEGGIDVELGNYTDYHRRLEATAAPEPDPEPDPVTVAAPEPESAAVVITSKGKPRRKSTADVEKRLAKIEREIAQMEGKVNDVADALAIASADHDVDAVARLGEEYERLQGALDAVYQQWESITQERDVVAAEASA
jgi:ATP-binding cassette, subfamily F, member 3